MKLASTAMSLAAMGMVIGCHSPKKTSNASFFTPVQDQAEIDAFGDRQAAAAAHADPSFYASHFDGTNLNSLGTAKLDSLLMSTQRPAATTIYLAGAADTPEHREAISKYLTCHGWKTGQLTFAAGPNPNIYSMAARSISDLDKANNAAAPTADSGGGSMSAGIGGK